MGNGISLKENRVEQENVRWAMPEKENIGDGDVGDGKGRVEQENVRWANA